MKNYFLVAFVLVLAACKKDKGVPDDIAIDMTPIQAQGDILFISRRISNSSDWQLMMMNADGTNQRPVSHHLVRCAPPVVSNNGSRIAFTTYENNIYNLYVIGTDGQGLTLLSTGKQFCGNPAWSGDDSRIAFVKNDNATGGHNDIYSINTNGTNEIRLTNQHDNASPQFVPGINRLIYTSYNYSFSGIYEMNPDGSNKRLLTPSGKSFSGPRISPDGKMVAVTSNDWAGSQIFVMNSDGSFLKQITFTVSPRHIDTGYPRDANSSPVWSPGSNRLVYVSYENGSPDIFVINSNGTGNKRLTDTPLRDENPYWTKDGNYIVFSSNRELSVSSEIYIMRTEGQLQTPLTNFIADDIYPVLIPD